MHAYEQKEKEKEKQKQKQRRRKKKEETSHDDYSIVQLNSINSNRNVLMCTWKQIDGIILYVQE